MHLKVNRCTLQGRMLCTAGSKDMTFVLDRTEAHKRKRILHRHANFVQVNFLKSGRIEIQLANVSFLKYQHEVT